MMLPIGSLSRTRRLDSNMLFHLFDERGNLLDSGSNVLRGWRLGQPARWSRVSVLRSSSREFVQIIDARTQRMTRLQGCGHLAETMTRPERNTGCRQHRTRGFLGGLLDEVHRLSRGHRCQYAGRSKLLFRQSHK